MKYIQNQIQEDQIVEQISMKEYIGPFMASLVKGSKWKKHPMRVLAVIVLRLAVFQSTSSAASTMPL